MTDEDFLRQALLLAEEHSADGLHGPFGAVVVQTGTVVGQGWNQVVAEVDPTAHAEIMAIRDAGRRLGTHALEGTTIYCSCEPCPMCLSAIYWARIDRVVYAASARDAEDAGFDDAHILQEMVAGWGGRKVEGERLLAEEGKRVLEGWTRNPRRVAY